MPDPQPIKNRTRSCTHGEGELQVVILVVQLNRAVKYPHQSIPTVDLIDNKFRMDKNHNTRRSILLNI